MPTTPLCSATSIVCRATPIWPPTSQEAFVRLYRRGSLPDRPDRWLVTVALNLFRNERSTARRRAWTGHGAISRRWPTDARRPCRRPRAAGSSQCRSTASRGATGLLLRAEGYDYRDLATILELNEASVGTLLARARQAFRAKWEER